MKPKTFIRNTPHLPVKNLVATLNYYREKLGFTNEWTFGEKDGGISRDDLQLLFVEDAEFVSCINGKHHRFPLVWFVYNIEEILSEYLNNGIDLADDLKIHAYGLREFAFIDINGYYIRVAEADGD